MAKPAPKAEKSKKPSDAEIARVLGEAFWNISNHYGLTNRDVSTLLGIKENRQRIIDLKGANKIPDTPDQIMRASHVAGIHKSLRIMFPNNRDVVYKWMKTPRELFEGKSAMDYISEEPLNSMARLFTVRRLLDKMRVS